jgi:hypothetical protein
VVQTQLQHAGFQGFPVTPVPHQDNLPWNVDWILLEARKQTCCESTGQWYNGYCKQTQ